MAVSRIPFMFVCVLAMLALVSSGSNMYQMSIEPIPLWTEVEQGQHIDQSVMFRMHSPESHPDVAQKKSTSQQDLILVLDVSGSMRGAKLEKAKSAISGIVNSLGANDHLHLITYHTTAKVEFTKGTVDNREQLLALVAKLTPQSRTNLYAGLEEAEAILGLQSDRESTKRVFLFSDGLVNEGVTDRRPILKKVEKLRGKGTTTAAFGIGEDYDQELMSAIAEVGHGEFFFIQGQEDMEKVVRVAFAGFRNLFATDAELRVTPLNVASDLHVYGQSTPGHQDKSIGVRIGDLHSGVTNTVLVDIKLPGLNENVEYMSYELEYTPVDTKSGPVIQRGSVAIRITEVGVSEAAPNSAVLLFRQLQQMLRSEEEIEKQIKLGNVKAARSLEYDLKGNLHRASIQACSEQDTQEQVYTCSRAKVALGRTMNSLAMMDEASPAMASNAYQFKRQMNMKMSESYDEL